MKKTHFPHLKKKLYWCDWSPHTFLQKLWGGNNMWHDNDEAADEDNCEPEKHQPLINTELMTGDGRQESQRNWRDKLSRAQNTHMHLPSRSAVCGCKWWMKRSFNFCFKIFTKGLFYWIACIGAFLCVIYYLIHWI